MFYVFFVASISTPVCGMENHLVDSTQIFSNIRNYSPGELLSIYYSFLIGFFFIVVKLFNFFLRFFVFILGILLESNKRVFSGVDDQSRFDRKQMLTKTKKISSLNKENMLFSSDQANILQCSGFSFLHFWLVFLWFLNYLFVWDVYLYVFL